jgi:hypothetical protein
MTTDQLDMLLEITQDTTFAPGFRHQAQALLEGKDLTGGLVDRDMQMAEMERQYLAANGSYN